MKDETRKVYEAAASLSERERAELVIRLLDGLGADPEDAAAQARESASRLAALKAGEIETIDSDAALRLVAG